MTKIDNYKLPNMDKFNSSPKKATFQICEDIMVFLIFYPVVLNILGIIYGNTIALTQGIPLILYIIALALTRIKIKNHILGVISNLILFCIFLSIPFPIYERIIYGVYALIMLMNSIHRFFKITFNFYNLLFFKLGETLLGVNLLLSYGLNNSLAKYSTLFSALMFSLLFLFYFSRNRYRLLIGSEKTYYNHTTKVDLHSKKFIAALFFAFFIFTSFILLITSAINSKGNYALTHEINSILFPSTGINSSSINYSHNKSSYNHISLPQLSNLIFSHNTKSSFTDLLNKIFYITAYFLLTIILFIIIFKIIRFAIKLKFKDQAHEEIESTFLKEDFIKDIKRIIPKFKSNLSNKDKLRKYYKKLIKHYGKNGLKIKASSTPMELKDEILNLTSNNLENITKIYDKTRYSLYEPTKEDIDKLIKK